MRNRIGARRKKASSGSSMPRNGSLTDFSKKRSHASPRLRRSRNRIAQTDRKTKAAADRSGVVDCLLDRLKIVGLLRDRGRSGGERRALEARSSGPARLSAGAASLASDAGRPSGGGRVSNPTGLLPQGRSSPADAGNPLFYINPARHQTDRARHDRKIFRQFLPENRNPEYNASHVKKAGGGARYRLSGEPSQAIGAYRIWRRRERRKIVWIRRNPLKSPESAKGIQDNASDFVW